MLRRTHATRTAASAGGPAYDDGTLTVDIGCGQVLRDGTAVALTATERRLLFLLVENAGRIVPTDRILEAVWGPVYREESDYVKLYVWRLRQKIEANPEEPKYLLTERGVGYRFAGRAAGVKREI